MKYIVSVLLLCMTVNFAFAQEAQMYTSSGRADHGKKKKKQEGFDASRLIFGGGVALGFGSDYADLGVSPAVGYRLTNRWSAGVSLGYEYYKNTLYDYQNDSYTEKANIIYPGIWTRFNVSRRFFLVANYEYDMIHYSERYVDGYSGTVVASDATNVNVSCLLLGIGIKYPVFGNASLIVEGLYDVLQNNNSPYYGIPVIRAGIMVGL